MGFVASEEIESLTYDFNPHVDVKGTIPEPTTDQVDAYRAAFFNSAKQLLGVDEDGDSVEAQMRAMDKLLETNKEVEIEATKATADLTGISFDVLVDLPFRVRSAFLGWVMGVFLNPEA